MLSSHNFKLKKRISKFLASAFQNSDDDFLIELVLDRFLWTATEDNDLNERVKYLGQPYWSKEAILRYQNQNDGRKTKNFKDLRHEHIVPRAFIKEKILNLPQKTAEGILTILDNYSHAVIVTKEEDKKLKEIGLNQKMSETFYTDGDILSRYKQAIIDIIEVEEQDLKKIAV